MMMNKALKMILSPAILIALLLSAGCSLPVCCGPQAETQTTELVTVSI